MHCMVHLAAALHIQTARSIRDADAEVPPIGALHAVANRTHDCFIDAVVN
jgi:hypothetical protein